MGWAEGLDLLPDRRAPTGHQRTRAAPRSDSQNIRENFADFLAAIRSDGKLKPVSDIGEVHLATNMALLGMISLKLGKSLEGGTVPKERIVGDPPRTSSSAAKSQKGYEVSEGVSELPPLGDDTKPPAKAELTNEQVFRYRTHRHRRAVVGRLPR